MPWYKLPHADMVMHFDQEMPDLEPADEPFATGGVFKGHLPTVGYPDGVIDEVVIPNAPKPEEEAEAT